MTLTALKEFKMERIVEKPIMCIEELLAYNSLRTLAALVDDYFMERALELCPSGRILDVGCGTGRMLRRIEGDFELHGTDLDEMAVRIGKDMGGRVSYRVAHAKNMPYDSDSFDLVMCHSTLHHIEEPVDAINEMIRVAKPHGSLFVRDLARPKSEKALQKMILGYLASNYDDINRRLFEESLRSSLSPGEWKPLFSEFHTSSVLIYNIAERSAKGLTLNAEQRKYREAEFIRQRLECPLK